MNGWLPISDASGIIKTMRNKRMAQRYDTYKDSGVQWLGEIPGHWGCARLKNVASFISGYAFDSNSFSIEGEVPVIRISDIQNDTVSFENCVYVPYNNKLSVFETKDDDLLIAMSGATTGKTGLVKGQYGYINQRVGIIRSEYIHLIKYSLRMPSFMDYIMLQAEGSAQPNISATGINQFYIPLPPLSEQHAIVSYLDDKCGKIDEWIEKKQKEVELLGEMKQRVIADAVTRGLNTNVKMKPTNIVWLPEVPEHWNMSKVSSHFKQRNEKVSDKDYPALSVSKQGVTPQLDNVALSNAEGASRKLVKVGDYAVNSRSDRKGSCGISKYEGSVSLITIVLEPFDIDGEYVHYLFRSNPWVEEFYRNGRGIVADLWTTNFQMMKGMYLPVPPLEEQKQIVAHITDKTSKIDKLIANINKEIEGIKEYKQRLISDVVTGQIKVC